MKAIIFDMDGVLIDSERHHIQLLTDFFNKHQKIVTFKQAASLIGKSNHDSFVLMHEWFDEGSFEDFVDAYVAFYQEQEIDYVSLLKQNVVSTLKEVKAQGIPTGLASSSSMPTIQKVLTMCDLHDYFDVVVSGEQFKASKPHPEIYLYTASKLGVEPEACLVVEDSYPGIVAGKKAGATVLAIKDPTFQIDQSLADDVHEDIAHVLTKINEYKHDK